jgi:hypothetical protein
MFEANRIPRSPAPTLSIALAGALAALSISFNAAAQSTEIDTLRSKFGPKLLLVGPISKINPIDHSGEVLGQGFRISERQNLTLPELQDAQMVAVIGEIDCRGAIVATEVKALGTNAVEGATEVLITGMVNSIERSVGVATIGKMRINYTATLSTPNTAFNDGDFIRITGVFFQSNKIFLVDHTWPATESINRVEGDSVNLRVANPVSPIMIAKGGSMGSGRNAAGSMGSGITNFGGSLGPEVPGLTAKGGSMGYGRAPGGSMGSGVNNLGGSMGSGVNSIGGSMGSGSPAVIAKGGSMGSGRSSVGLSDSGSAAPPMRPGAPMSALTKSINVF